MFFTGCGAMTPNVPMAPGVNGRSLMDRAHLAVRCGFDSHRPIMWITNLLDKLTCFLPRPLLVAPDEGGYRISPRLNGTNKVKELKPGWYLWIPLFQRTETMMVKIQPKDLRSQSLWTKDGTNIMISGVIKYKVSDPVKALLEVYDYDNSVQIIALGAIHEFVSSHTLDELKAGIVDLLEKILTELRKESQGWGLKIVSVKLTDTGDVFNLRVLQNE